MTHIPTDHTQTAPVSISPAEIHISPDGTVRSLAYEDIYFAPQNGIAESTFVFLDGCQIIHSLPHISDTHTVLELGFGTGLNFLLTLQAFARANKAHLLHFISTEKHPIHPDDIRRIYDFLPAYLQPYADAVLHAYPPLTQGVHTMRIRGATLTLYFEDILQAIPHITAPIDSVYLDGFAPSKNATMWEHTLFSHIYNICTPTAYISTFTASSAVQKALKKAGFFVHKRQGFGRKRESIIARKTLWHPPTVHTTSNIAIIGAGVMGIALAHHLAQSGHRVTLYDSHPHPLMGTSGNPYAMLLPKFNKNIPFHKNAYTYACMYFDNLKCIVGDGIIATPHAISDPTPYTDICHPHVQGIKFKYGAVKTNLYADVVLSHPNIQFVQKNIDAIPHTFDLTILCLGADTNTLLPRPVTYTINRGSIALIKTPPSHMPTTPTYHKGYAYSDGNIGVCGTHFERIGDWQRNIPPINTNTHIKHIADKMHFFNIDLYNTNYTLRTGIRVNTKNRTPVIQQIFPRVFSIYGMGSRGYINAPYTAHLFCQYVLQYTHHTDLLPMFSPNI